MPVRRRRCPALVPLLAAVVACTAAFAQSPDPVLVSIKGPLTGRVGERASFEVELLNQSGRPLQGLHVVDYFDRGLRHDASASPIEQKGTIAMAPGTSQRLTLDFQLTAEGRQCHRVEVFDSAYNEAGGATHCIEVQPAVAAAPQRFAQPAAPVQASPQAAPPQPAAAAVVAQPVPVPPLASATTPPPLAAPAQPRAPALTLDMTGPTEVVAGGTAKFVATVTNRGTGSSEGTTLVFTLPEGLAPSLASDGYKPLVAGVTGGWSLEPIAPGQSQVRELLAVARAGINAYSDSPPTRSCVRAELGTLGGGQALLQEACVLITSTTPRPRLRTPSEAGLRLTLADLDDPVRPGDATTLVCTVSNDGDAAVERIDLEIRLPRQARFLADRSSAFTSYEGETVRFSPISSLPSRGQRSFEIAYRMDAGGTGRASASLRGANLDGGLDRSCETEFLDGY